MFTAGNLDRTTTSNSAIRATLITLLIVPFCLGLASEARADWWKFGRRKARLSGHIITKTYDLKDFDAVSLKGIADVEIIVGEDYSVEVKADEDYLEYIDIDVYRGELEIDMFDDHDWNFDFDESIQIRISMPKLTSVALRGVGDLLVENFSGEELEVSLGGVGDIEIEGEVDQLEVTVSGVGDANLRKLTAKEAWARVSGMGDLKLTVTESLDARVSGFGDITYYGRPRDISRSVSGFGEIVARR